MDPFSQPKAKVPLMSPPRRTVLFGLVGLLQAIACVHEAELPQPAAPVPVAETVPPAAAVADAFWIHEEQEEVRRPPLRPVRSISLGYVGDEPLGGSVMRDTPLAPPANDGPGRTWQEYNRQPSWPDAWSAAGRPIYYAGSPGPYARAPQGTYAPQGDYEGYPVAPGTGCACAPAYLAR